MDVTYKACDNCGKHLKVKLDVYRPIQFKTDRSWDGVEMDWHSVDIELCEACARQCVKSLQKIAEKK